MKRTIFAIALALGSLIGSAVAGPSPLYQNYAVITNYPVIDAVAFDNHGTIAPELSPNDSILYNQPFIFDTRNTRYFTNSGVMEGSLGFRFDYLAPRGQMYVHTPAQFFTNSGTISGIDYGYTTLGVAIGSFYLSGGSYVLASANTIGNSGMITVGDSGLLQLSGQNVSLSDGVLLSGTFGNTNAVSYFNYGRSIWVDTNEYINAGSVQDLYWGAGTNTMDLLTLASGTPAGWTPQTPSEIVTWASYGTNSSYVSLPMYGTLFGAWVYTNFAGSNTYVNIVFVRTNGLDSNTTVDVRFNTTSFYNDYFVTNYDANAVEPVVSFGAAVPDVVTGGIITNNFYLIDSGAGQESSIFLLTNFVSGAERPSCFEIATSTPYEWIIGTNGNATYTPSLIYPGNTYTAETVGYVFGAYGAQVGRNSQTANGVFNNVNNNNYYGIYTNSIHLFDASNGTARIEVSAANLDLSRARLRAEGFLSLRATNVIATAPAMIDAGSMNIDLGSTNGFLSISNILPSVHVRAEGDVYAWAANWSQTETNDTTTNYYQFHVLVVDHNLQGNQTPTIEDLALHGKNVYIQDTVRVINTAVFDAESLTINGPVSFWENGGSLASTNLPKLKNLFVETNGSLIAGNMLNCGWDTAKGLNSYTNQGVVESSTVMVKADALENRGTVATFSNGSMWFETKNLNLQTSPVLSQQVDPITLNTTTGYASALLYSDRDVEIHAGVMTANGSTIDGGISGGGKLTFWVTNQLSDGVSSVPTGVSVLTNFWNAKNGFRLPLKPKVGDLFGTELTTSVTNNQWADHLWSADDRGASVAGFTNNAVIGHMVLNRQGSGNTLHFSGVGAKSAMYVDYLDFQNDATNYQSGLVIDKNLTIYFAASNVDPSKLQSLYPNRLVWVPEFSGPNSSTLVAAHVNGLVTSVYCNSTLATSPDIDSNGNGVPNASDPFPLDGSILSINVNGQGSVSPNQNGRALLIGHNYALTAVPQPGYIFTGWTWQNAGPALVVDAKQANIAFSMQSNLVLTATFIPDPAVLRVTINGNGTVAPLNAQPLVFGKTYSLTATPAAGNLFASWSGGVVSSARTIRFVMSSNLVLQASFTTNNLPNFKGVYNGLFYVNNDGATVNSSGSNDVAFVSSGAFALTVANTGVASGRLYMSAGALPFTTVFDQDGSAQVVVKRQGKSSLTVNLQINVGGTNEISGHVVDNGNWDAVLLGDRANYTARSTAPTAGSYRVALMGLGAGQTGPAGDGYGTVIVSPLGQVSMSCNLPDGTTIQRSAWIGNSGRWPLYVTRAGKDSLLGWITCDTNTATMSGKVSWIKQAGVTRYYSAGFADTFDFVGSRYTIPTDHTAGLVLRTPVLVLSGDPEVAGSYLLVLNTGKMTLTSADGSGVVSLILSPRTGTFGGRVVDRNTGVAKALNGVLLQGQGEGLGCFYSAGISGEVRLQNNEY